MKNKSKNKKILRCIENISKHYEFILAVNMDLIDNNLKLEEKINYMIERNNRYYLIDKLQKEIILLKDNTNNKISNLPNNIEEWKN